MEEKQLVQALRQKDFRGLEALIDDYGFAICQAIRIILCDHCPQPSLR